MTLELQLRTTHSIPIEIEGITPCAVRESTLEQVEQHEVFLGNRTARLADFFEVSGDPSDERMVIRGDCSGIHWIGAKMQSGEIRVEGNAGRHLGSEMTGGEIHVTGDAGDWVGAELKGGEISVAGRAGHLAGAAYRGSPRGMTGGEIYIGGDAGNEIGHSMRRGLIAIGGNIGDLAGFNMLAGTVFVLGDGGIRHGAGMRRGTIALLGDAPVEVLPTFRFACQSSPLILQMLARQVAQRGLLIDRLNDMSFDVFNGDFLEGGRGELITLARSANIS